MHFLRRFLVFIQKYVYYHFIFPKINKRGGWNKSGGLENLSKINKRGGGRLFGTREYFILTLLKNNGSAVFKAITILPFLCHELAATCLIHTVAHNCHGKTKI